MKNERAPRTLSECAFVTGYTSASITTRGNWNGWWFAVLIGVAVATVLVYG